jgi:hypothetical protein
MAFLTMRSLLQPVATGSSRLQVLPISLRHANCVRLPPPVPAWLHNCSILWLVATPPSGRGLDRLALRAKATALATDLSTQGCGPHACVGDVP